MKETVEFRIPEERAACFLEPQEGKCLGGSVRVLKVSTDDPLYGRIGEINRQFEKEGRPFFLGWDIKHHYSRRELEYAELYRLEITAVFEPAGEECGTVYDESMACPLCGSGRTQVSDLMLDLRQVPKNKDIACTIADEWIVSQRFAELLVDTGITGVELRPVRHKARYQDDPVDLAMVPSGRELLRLAQEAGMSPSGWDFMVWLNRPEQEGLAKQAREEHASLLERRARHRHKPTPVWYQLVATSAPVPTVAPTRFGIHPFNDDSEGLYRCPHGHVSGLNLLSELWVSRAAWDGSDVTRTADMVGVRRGVLVPRPLLLISARLWRLLKEHEIKGYKVEIARFV